MPVLVLEILFLSLNEAKNCKIPLRLTPRGQAVLEQTKLVYQGLILLNFIFPHSFVNADCFTSRIDPRDAFFDVHRYVPVVTFMQYFINNTVVLACQSRRRFDFKYLSK